MKHSGTNLSVNLQETFITEAYYQKRILVLRKPVILAHKDTKELDAQTSIKDTSVHKVQSAWGGKDK